MEDVLKHLNEKTEDKGKVQSIFHLLKVYVTNIVQNPTNGKYRKIRKSNPKFHSTIWSNEDARSFLLLAGFEESNDFLELPEGVHLHEAKTILDVLTTDDVKSGADSNTQSSTSTQQQQSSSVLQLRGSSDSSMFDETSKPDMTLLSYMKEMGFDVAVAEKALIMTMNQGVQPAMDWINSNPGKVSEIQMAQFHQTSSADKTVEQNPAKTGDVAKSERGTGSSTITSPVSRYQTTLDERHRFQERVRLEAIEAARLEKAEQKRQKEYLLKNLEDERKERKEKGERVKTMRMQDGSATTTGETGERPREAGEDENNSISLRIRLPDGRINNLKLGSHSCLEEIYKHISSISGLKENDFVIMTVAPQIKLTEKGKTLDDLGLKSQETLIVQRVDQAGTMSEGHGTFRQILEVRSLAHWGDVQWQNRDQLIVAQFYVPSEDDWERFEDLNRKFGIDEQALFVRINFELEPAFKEVYDLESFPSYKLLWNNETLLNITDPECLETSISENMRGPVAERVADGECEEYFDPR
ncbi:uncharacterized protein LOC114522573 [Dendronephthya gigantea]|uniref:uncharacterized protein LOC114522573 n=1 Tax=Dendronephthya gigantea TaxID=151771 RepID=UPI00106CF8EA|nr:uncharacterized protein LOC114522573 [Dendronephthya gigantea]XP_028399103.1 uncharacterized protein LOC114522573 [Dendronephthya gigantea]